jgi:predicted secreted Zn-dependent protease
VRGSGRLPDPLDLDEAKPGLNEQLDPPQYYRVTGNTSAEVTSRLDACTPVAPYWGQAGWYVNYKYWSAEADGTCAVAGVTVGLHTNTYLPAWSPAPGAEPGLAQKWRRFIAAFELHEQLHVDIARRHAAKIAADLQRVSAPCDTFADAVSGTFERDMDALEEEESAYDERTDHGATQGAVLE